MDRERARKHVTSVVRKSRTTFYWAMRVLPADQRNAMYAVYAFCREVDDIADLPGDKNEKLSGLDHWRQEIESVYLGNPNRPISIALLEPIRKYHLRKETFLSLIEGMEKDSAGQVRMPTFSDLESYCNCVACSVGRLSNQIFGVQISMVEPLAFSLGQALQLTNILRDLYEDAEKDRLYIPLDMLSKFHIPITEPKKIIGHPNFPSLCSNFTKITKSRYQEAMNLLAKCEVRKIRPAIIMMQNYQYLLEKLIKRGWRQLDEPVFLTNYEKVEILFRYMIKNFSI